MTNKYKNSQTSGRCSYFSVHLKILFSVIYVIYRTVENILQSSFSQSFPFPASAIKSFCLWHLETGRNVLLKYGGIAMHQSLSKTNNLQIRTYNLHQHFSETYSKMAHTAECRKQLVIDICPVLVTHKTYEKNIIIYLKKHINITHIQLIL